MRLQEIQSSTGTWLDVPGTDGKWFRLQTAIGQIDISEKGGRFEIRAIDGILLVEPMASNAIVLRVE